MNRSDVRMAEAELKHKVRLTVVIHGLITAFALLGIAGMAVPNCMQTVPFGEALWHMRVDSEMPSAFLLVLVEIVLAFAYTATKQNFRARISVASAGLLTGVLI